MELNKHWKVRPKKLDLPNSGVLSVMSGSGAFYSARLAHILLAATDLKVYMGKMRGN